MICGTCGCDNPGHLVFCQECGQRLGPRVAPPTPPVAVAPSSAGGSAAAAKNPCARCGSDNQPGVRYCVTCGNVLAGLQPAAAPPPVPPSAPAVAPEQPRALVAQPSPPAPPIVPAAVYQIAAPAPTPLALPVAASPVTSATRACPRCRGASDDLAQFCRFCGAALAPGAVVVKTPTVPDPSVASFWRPPALAGLAEASRASAIAVSAELPGVPPTLDGDSQGPSSGSRALASAPADTEARPTDAPAQMPSYGRIVIITKEGGEGASYALREQLDIGRSEGEVIIADDRYLSPRHARLSRRVQAGKPPEFVLVDLASTNGIYLRVGRDGAREAALEDQDLFLVGQQVLKFDVVRDAEEGLAPATQHGTLLFGTPTVPRYARLSQRTVEGVTRDVFHVQKAETVLGRESGDIVFTDDPFLSRRHAAIKFDHEGRRFVLTDLGSSNGTFVQIRGQVTIKSGDQFRIGQQLFRVDLSAASAP